MLDQSKLKKVARLLDLKENTAVAVSREIERLDSAIENIQNDSQKVIQIANEIDQSLETRIERKVAEIPHIRGDRGFKGETGEAGRDGVDGRNGIDGKDGKDGINGKDGKDGLNAVVDYTKVSKEIDEKLSNGLKDIDETPEEIRNKLETLKGEDRLDKSAIKGLDDELKKATTIINQYNRTGGGSGGGTWGSIIGTLSDQTDLQDALNTKSNTDEKVKYNVSDATAGYLADKIVAGAGISLAEGTGGDVDKLVITNSGVITETDPVFEAWKLATPPLYPSHLTDFTHADIAHTNRADLDLVSGTNTGDQTLPTRDSLGLDTDDTVTFANLSGTNTGDQVGDGVTITGAGTVADPFVSVGGGSGASTALDNLASVAINTSLISDTDSTDDLGSTSKQWANVHTDRILSTISDLTIENDLSDGNIIFKVNDGGVDTEVMRLDGATGRVGIGTASPSYLLHVKGESQILGEWSSTTDTTESRTGLRLGHSTTQDMADGFGTSLTFMIGDGTYSLANIGGIGAIRDGADFEGALTFRAGTSGAEEFMRITSGGLVGIGTAAPDQKLTVVDGGAFTQVRGVLDTYTTSAGYGSVFGLRHSNSNTIGTLVATVDTQILGTVGGYGVDSGNAAFVYGGGLSFVQSGVAGSSRIPIDILFSTSIGGTTAPAERMRITSAGDVKIPADSKKLLFGAGDDASITYNGTNLLINPREVGSGDTIFSAGNVGIGNSAPASTLHITSGVSANTLRLDSKDSGVTGLVLANLGTTRGTIGVVRSNGNYFTNSLAGDITFRSEAHNLLFGRGGGAATLAVGTSVGIGTTSPSQKLTLSDATAAIFLLQKSGTSAKNWYITNSAAGTQKFSISDDSAYRFVIDNTGNVGIGTTVPTSKLQVVGLVEYANNTAAAAAGLTTGAFYRTGEYVKVVY